MPIPGLVLARRRRASRGRAAPLILPCPTPNTIAHPSRHQIRHRLSNVLPIARSKPAFELAVQVAKVLAYPIEAIFSSRTPFSGTGRSQRNDLHGLAMAARNRLDVKLRASDPVCRRQDVSPSSGSMLTNWHESHFLNGVDRDTREWLVVEPRSLRNQTSGLRLGKESKLKGKRFFPQEKKVSKDCDEDDCPVCLDRFSSGQSVMCLPCEHRFHRDCLTPWLERHSQCPVCRANIPDQLLLSSRSNHRKAEL